MCSVNLRAIEPPRLRDDVASMAWRLHAIEQTQLRGEWGAQSLISTQEMGAKELGRTRRSQLGVASTLKHDVVDEKP